MHSEHSVDCFAWYLLETAVPGGRENSLQWGKSTVSDNRENSQLEGSFDILKIYLGSRIHD
jgi:hypothetical protein